ncbi:hypothetical protein B0H10DRAFT_1951129 [Mycena sp. CBHHK59/15]|nr:hypothetical protein B0H10DRAFT_1951129 [Mycena sp. CBHHK59/15]
MQRPRQAGPTHGGFAEPELLKRVAVFNPFDHLAVYNRMWQPSQWVRATDRLGVGQHVELLCHLIRFNVKDHGVHMHEYDLLLEEIADIVPAPRPVQTTMWAGLLPWKNGQHNVPLDDRSQPKVLNMFPWSLSQTGIRWAESQMPTLVHSLKLEIWLKCVNLSRCCVKNGRSNNIPRRKREWHNQCAPQTQDWIMCWDVLKKPSTYITRIYSSAMRTLSGESSTAVPASNPNRFSGTGTNRFTLKFCRAWPPQFLGYYVFGGILEGMEY